MFAETFNEILFERNLLRCVGCTGNFKNINIDEFYNFFTAYFSNLTKN